MLTALLLGNAQDAGLPQAGCTCENCRAAWESPSRRRWVSALGLIDHAAGQWFMIDATPDLREQLHRMQTEAGDGRLAGVLITHAHIGHYTGLIHFGYEAMAAHGLPLFGTPRLNEFLRANAPWRQLVEQGNLTLHDLTPDAWHPLTSNLAVSPVHVPHRDEWSDTVGFIVRGPQGRLLYLPDIDSWDQWDRRLEDVIKGIDVALLDGTFLSSGELPERATATIGHPLVTDTAARLIGSRADVRFIHLNHSNPLHRRGPEREWLETQGLKVGEAGDRWGL